MKDGVRLAFRGHKVVEAVKVKRGKTALTGRKR